MIAPRRQCLVETTSIGAGGPPYDPAADRPQPGHVDFDQLARFELRLDAQRTAFARHVDDVTGDAPARPAAARPLPDISADISPAVGTSKRGLMYELCHIETSNP